MFYTYRIVLAITKAKLYTKVNKNILLKRDSSAVENRISIVIKKLSYRVFPIRQVCLLSPGFSMGYLMEPIHPHQKVSTSLIL